MSGDVIMGDNENSRTKKYGFISMAIKEIIKEELDGVKLIPEEKYSNVIHRLIEFYKENKKEE